jgi:DNA-binding MarR family transcriptional regulator
MVPTMPAKKGPLPRFAEIHVREALELIGRYGRIGRKDLANELRIGEGSVRTILDQLKKRDLITSSRGGHFLTAKGRRTLGKPLKFVRVDAGDLTVGKVDVATVVRGAADKIKKGIEQRDAAIKAGAAGATVLVFKGGKLQFPDKFIEVEKKLSETIMGVLKPHEGDAIVIGTGDDVASAEAGVRAAARTLTRT